MTRINWPKVRQVLRDTTALIILTPIACVAIVGFALVQVNIACIGQPVLDKCANISDAVIDWAEGE